MDKTLRRIRKTLSLVIVLTMAISMVPYTGALTTSDDYLDKDDITNREAVDVLSAISVMEGSGSDGARNFRPKDLVTRAEAAAIIARLVLTRRVADVLPKTETTFKDVSSDHWASGYIGWCVSAGIVAGYGDGRFGPADNVTASQFAAMLLRAIGWGKRGEYTGRDWEVNATIDALRYGIFSGNGDFSKAADREHTAMYTFNALTAELMVWVNDTQSYRQENTEPGEHSFRTKMYRDPKLEARPAERDAFQRPAKKWFLGDDEIGTYVSTPNLRFTTPVAQSDIYKGLGLRSDFNDAKLLIDNSAAVLIDIGNTAAPVGTINGTGNGVITDVYYDRINGTMEIIIVNTWLAEVLGINEATEDNPRTVDLAVYGTVTSLTAPTRPARINRFATDSFEKGDWLLITMTDGYSSADNVVSAKLAPTVENASINSFIAGTEVTFLENAHKFALNMDDEKFKQTGFLFSPTSYIFFLDDFDYVLGYAAFTPVASALNFAYVKDWRFVEGTNTGLSAQPQDARVEIVTMAGATAIHALEILTVGEKAPGDGEYAAGLTMLTGEKYINFPDENGVEKYYRVAGAYRLGTAEAANGIESLNAFFADESNRLVSYVIRTGGAGIALSRQNKVTIIDRTTRAVLMPVDESKSLVFTRNSPGITGFTPAFANANTRLVTLSAENRITTYQGFTRFPLKWDFTASRVEAPVIFVYTETVITSILVIGASYPPTFVPEGYALWAGVERTVAGGAKEYMLYANGRLTWYRLEGDITELTDMNVVYEFGLNPTNNRAILSAPAGIDDCRTILSVDAESGFIVFKTGDPQFSPLFSEDILVYDVESDNAADWGPIRARDLKENDEILLKTQEVDGVLRVIVIFLLHRP